MQTFQVERFWNTRCQLATCQSPIGPKISRTRDKNTRHRQAITWKKKSITDKRFKNDKKQFKIYHNTAIGDRFSTANQLFQPPVYNIRS